MPEASPIDSRDLLAIAVSYVEHYRGDVLQLEHEREFLFGAVTQAWQQAAYSVVVRLVTGLAQLTGRFSNYADTYVTFLRLRELASQMAAPHVYKCSSFLERHLARVSPENCRDIAGRQDRLDLSTPPVKLHESLSERELEVLQLVAAGLSNREIAGRLVITTSTVKKHLEHIYTTLNVHSRTSAIAKARAIQLLT